MVRKFDYIIRKVLGKSLRNHDFYRFENRIKSSTKKSFKKTFIDSTNDSLKPQIIEPYYKEIRENTINKFKDCFELNDATIMFYKPSLKKAIGTYSAFTNIAVGLSHIGVDNGFFEDLNQLNTYAETGKKRDVFVFLEKQFLLESKETVDKIKSSNKQKNIYVGVALHPNQEDGYINEIIKLYSSGRINFCYTFSAIEYVQKVYSKLLQNKVPVFDMEFGANPFIHYPVKLESKPLDYIFLGSTNRRKWDRYFEYFTKPFQNHHGFIFGPGWTRFYKENKRFEVDAFLYARAKVGLNLSVPSQLGEPRELNERTYQLAACGIPQLIDNPTLLFHRFDKDSIFSADNSKDYYATFLKLLSGEIDSNSYVKKAYSLVMDNHTIFHRSKHLAEMINSKFYK